MPWMAQHNASQRKKCISQRIWLKYKSIHELISLRSRQLSNSISCASWVRLTSSEIICSMSTEILARPFPFLYKIWFPLNDERIFIDCATNFRGPRSKSFYSHFIFGPGLVPTHCEIDMDGLPGTANPGFESQKPWSLPFTACYYMQFTSSLLRIHASTMSYFEVIPAPSP